MDFSVRQSYTSGGLRFKKSMAMINRFFLIIAIFSVFCIGPAGARAQDCRVEYEAIINLHKPEYGAYNLWDTVYGEWSGDEVFRDGLAGPDGRRLTVIGERRGNADTELLFVQIGRNGRVFLNQAHRISGLEEVVSISPHQRGFAVFANRKNDQRRDVIWMGVFDLQGFLLAQSHVSDRKSGLDVYDVKASQDGKSYLLAASAKADASGFPASAVLYRVDVEGKVLSEKAFITGAENRISGLELLDDGGVVATGFSYVASGRRAGWIVRLDEKAGIVWQRVYPRGAAAELTAGALIPGNLLAVAGMAAPLNGGRKAGWVMTVDADNGEVGWQRFFSGDLDFYGRALQISSDGMISAILDGDAVSEKDEASHIRLVTLSPRGEIFSADAFYNGEAVDAFGFVSGVKSERIITGSSLVTRQADKKEERDKSSHQGWVLAVPSADPYKDVCALPNLEKR